MEEAEYPRVTEILRDMGLSKPYPEGVPAVEWGRARGSAVHRAIELWEASALDTARLHPDVEGPFQSYLKFKMDTGYTADAVEKPICHATLRYRGTLDSQGVYKGDMAILDFKCAKQPDLEAAAYQLGAYALAEQNGKPFPLPRYVIQLGEDSWRPYDVTSPEAVSIFEGAVRVWWAQRERLTFPKGPR